MHWRRFSFPSFNIANVCVLNKMAFVNHMKEKAWKKEEEMRRIIRKDHVYKEEKLCRMKRRERKRWKSGKTKGNKTPTNKKNINSSQKNSRVSLKVRIMERKKKKRNKCNGKDSIQKDIGTRRGKR